MRKPLHFEHSNWFPVPPEALFAFHERENALQLLSPPWPALEIVSRSGGIRNGARAVARLHLLGPVRATWVAVHTAYERNRLFEDIQESGPFSYWRHRHIFRQEGDGCRLTDSIDFSLPFAWISHPLMGWMIRWQMRKMFAYRHAVLARETAAIGAADRAAASPPAGSQTS